MSRSESLSGFSIVVAASTDLGIGVRQNMPWRIKKDMEYFKEVTSTTASPDKTNVVIMGRKTWDSIPAKFRPLPGRINVVVSRNENAKVDLGLPEGVHTATSLEGAITAASALAGVENVFIIGGGAIYAEAIASPRCQRIYFTEVHDIQADYDTYFPEISARKFKEFSRSPVHEEGGYRFTFSVFDRTLASSPLVPPAPPSPVGNAEEQTYLDLLRDIMDHGVQRGDRTGTGTLSKFGVQMRFSLRDDRFPLLTTKKVFWRGVAEELLWFVSGCTNANVLREKDIHIWDGNGSKEFLTKLGLGHREEGDLGPVYGFQWRHFGAKYEDMHADYRGKGIDQLKKCIETIVSNPEDRRILLTAWNPADLHLMALPPCHMFCQFYVANGELSCQMYQRSADMGLGVPFNIASYSLLTRLVAQVCHLRPGDFVHSIGDAHVYLNHVDALREQIKRSPRPFPRLSVNPTVDDIDGFKLSDFAIEDYNPYASIHMKMAV